MSNQPSLAWNKLDAELQRDVPKPRPDTTIASVIEQLEDRKDMWKMPIWVRTNDSLCRFDYSPHHTSENASEKTPNRRYERQY